jgi:hypothetical protein
VGLEHKDQRMEISGDLFLYKARISKHITCLGTKREKFSRVSARPETNYAGETQQQFTVMLWPQDTRKQNNSAVEG